MYAPGVVPISLEFVVPVIIGLPWTSTVKSFVKFPRAASYSDRLFGVEKLMPPKRVDQMMDPEFEFIFAKNASSRSASGFCGLVE